MEAGGGGVGGVGGAYGGGKAGGSIDPMALATRPAVILRAVCLLFSIIIFGCISSKGWVYDKELQKEVCLYNKDTNACNYGVGISVIAFLASIGLIAGEALFDQMSSVKTRKHYVLGDMGFSAFWAFLYFVGFCYLANQWGKSDDPEEGASNMRAAIFFSFFAIFTWAGCAFFAFQRFRMGTESAFAPSYEVEGALGGGGYSSYPGAPDPDPAYQDPPFSQQRGGADFQAPTY